MTQLKTIVDPFGEVNVYPAGGGRIRIVATILMEPHKEGAQTGTRPGRLPARMAKLYGARGRQPRFIRTSSAAPKSCTMTSRRSPNELCGAYLARKIDSDGGTTCIYWAVGPGGGQIEVVGDLTAEQAEKHVFGPSRARFPVRVLNLLPAVKVLCRRLQGCARGAFTSTSPTANSTTSTR